MQGRQSEIIGYLDSLCAMGPILPADVDAVSSIEAYLSCGGRFEELVERYAPRSCSGLVNGLVICLHRRTFSADSKAATQAALRIVELHKGELQAGTLNMLSAVLDYSAVRSGGARYTSALRQLLLDRMENCLGANPPIHFWPILDFLSDLIRANLLRQVLKPHDVLHVKAQLVSAFQRHGLSLDQEYNDTYDLIVAALAAIDASGS